MPRYWIAVASREHVKTGEAGGFCQLCHGKAGPVQHMAPDDWLIYYSPREKMRHGKPIQAFTAIGKIKKGVAYEFTMDSGFTPTRRDISYISADEAPIRPMLDALSFIANKRSWGMAFRRGAFEIPKQDFCKIAAAMGVEC